MKIRKIIKVMIPAYLVVFGLMIFFAKMGSDAVSTFAESAPIYGRTIIVIDPGHGGVDGGTTSVSGILESKLNLDISLKLRDLFNLLGIKTVMIRTEDVSVYTSGNSIAAQKISDLKERVRIVNSLDDCVLLSIHQNYFSDSRYFGPQVFFGPKGEGNRLAVELQQALIDNLNQGSSRRAKPADGVYLMQHIDTTGILVECGFLSNPNEDAKLQSKEYQQKLCVVIASVLSSYMNT